MARTHDLTRRDERGVARPGAYAGSPFQFLDRFAAEMDRVFEDFGVGRGWPVAGWTSSASAAPWAWAPEIEVFHRNNELIVRADLPGLQKDDVNVDVTDDHIRIQGERKQERTEEREGIYRSERSYGTFCRDIPLPPGVQADQAKASFRNGVLEVRVPAPAETARHGRRLEISDASGEKVQPVVKK